MRYARALLLSVALVTAAALPAAVVAHPGVAGPDPKRMALTREDVGYVASVEKEGYTTAGPIAASRGYRRDFSGLSAGTVQLLTVQSTVLIGKNPAAAGKLISSIVSASSSQAGRDSLYKQAAKSFGTSLGSPVTGGSVVRARALKAGDGAAEIVFRFDTADGGYQVGEVFVRLGGNLSVVYYGGVYPGLPAIAARGFAVNAAARLTEAGSTA